MGCYLTNNKRVGPDCCGFEHAERSTGDIRDWAGMIRETEPALRPSEITGRNDWKETPNCPMNRETYGRTSVYAQGNGL